MQKKFQKSFFGFGITAIEFVALNTRFYWENILVIGCHYPNKDLKISYTSKKAFVRLIFFQSDEKISPKHCRANLSSFSHPLNISLSKSVLIPVFWAFK